MVRHVSLGPDRLPVCWSHRSVCLSPRPRDGESRMRLTLPNMDTPPDLICARPSRFAYRICTPIHGFDDQRPAIFPMFCICPTSRASWAAPGPGGVYLVPASLAIDRANVGYRTRRPRSSHREARRGDKRCSSTAMSSPSTAHPAIGRAPCHRPRKCRTQPNRPRQRTPYESTTQKLSIDRNEVTNAPHRPRENHQAIPVPTRLTRSICSSRSVDFFLSFSRFARLTRSIWPPYSVAAMVSLWATRSSLINRAAAPPLQWTRPYYNGRGRLTSSLVYSSPRLGRSIHYGLRNAPPRTMDRFSTGPHPPADVQPRNNRSYTSLTARTPP